ncbi:MAG: competence/damage-inducible protein A [Actinomycetes bacterium]
MATLAGGRPVRSGRHVVTEPLVLHASIVVIGDEILGGFVQDANSGWLATRLQAAGVPLDRVTTVPDEMDAIDEALHAELARSRPRLVLTTGGIGSTPDDITYEAVAASLGRDLVVEPTMAARIDRSLAWSVEHGLEVTDDFAWHMHRMARVPAGARLIEHDGWAPGLLVDVDGGIEADGGATIAILPGVPSQMRAIVDDAIVPVLEARGTTWTVAELTHGFPESALNLCFADVIEAHPEVKLGSYPGTPMIVRLQGPEAAVAAAAETVRRAIDELRATPAGAALEAAWAARTS